MDKDLAQFILDAVFAEQSYPPEGMQPLPKDAVIRVNVTGYAPGGDVAQIRFNTDKD